MNWAARERLNKILLGAGAVILVVGLIWLIVWSEMRWRKYAAEWNCRHDGVTRSETYTYYTTMTCGKDCVMQVPNVGTHTYYRYHCDGGPMGEYVWR